MNFSLIWAFGFLLLSVQGQAARVSISAVLNPAGDFVASTEAVTGFAYKTPTGVAAEKIQVDVRTLKTGVSLRDTHLQKRLMADKFQYATLIRASGENGFGKGDFEIKGMKLHIEDNPKEKDKRVTYKIVGSNLEASFKIHLPDLKITDVNYGGLGVEDDVTVNVVVPLKDAPPGAVPTKPSAPTKKK